MPRPPAIPQDFLRNYRGLCQGVPFQYKTVDPVGMMQTQHDYQPFSPGQALHFLLTLLQLQVNFTKSQDCYLRTKRDFAESSHSVCTPAPPNLSSSTASKIRVRKVGSSRDPLSNFWPQPIVFKDIEWRSREHYIQAAKAVIVRGEEESDPSTLTSEAMQSDLLIMSKELERFVLAQTPRQLRSPNVGANSASIKPVSLCGTV